MKKKNRNKKMKKKNRNKKKKKKNIKKTKMGIILFHQGDIFASL